MPPPLDLLTPNEIHDFVDRLAADLAAAGMPDAAHRLNDVQGRAFTTGAEWRGELRLAARAIRRSRRVPADLAARLSRLLEADLVDRVALWQTWRAAFFGSIVLAGLAALVSVVTLATEGADAWATLAIAGLVAAVGVLGYSARRISRCPGCGTQAQHLDLEWCAFCGMRRSTGMPGPRRRPPAEPAPSPVLECPACHRPPSGRSRYGRPLPSEGHFCGQCGAALPPGPGR